MAVSSTMLPLGTPCPSFSLVDAVSGRTFTEKDFAGHKALLVSFLCNHCPYVVHVLDAYKKLEDDYAAKGLAIVGINSNDVRTHPQDAPPRMKELAQAKGWTFPFLFDETQTVAKAFQAACTPEFYLFDASRKLVYRGQLDDSRPSNGKPVTGKDLRAAIDALFAGKPVSPEQVPSIGCNIKWRS